jgi:hypothetical protein
VPSSGSAGSGTFFPSRSPSSLAWRQTDLDDAQEQPAAILWCAPSFEEFAYRFWVENRLWRAVRGADLSRLEPRLRDYLRHYAPPEVPACDRQ